MNVALLARSDCEMQTRLKAPDPHALTVPGSYNSTARTIEAIAATENPIPRYGVNEVLVMSADAADLSRAADGRMAFLFNHDPDCPIGTVVRVSIKNGQLIAVLRFADTPEGRKAEGQVARGELSQFSIGFSVRDWSQPNSTSDIVRAIDWELYEVSLVTIPADKAAVVRSLKGSTMDTEDDTIEPAARTTPPPSASSAAAQRGARAERARANTLADIGRRAGIEQLVIDEAIETGVTVEAFRERAFDTLVSRQVPTSHVRVERDEGDARMRDMALELSRAIAGEVAPRSPSAARYHGFSIVEMAAEVIGHRGRIPLAAGSREELLRRAFHSTSDFPLMFETATRGRLAERYASALPTYRQICARRDVPDFRPQPHYRPGDLPALEKLLEGGNISYGTFSESREYLAVAPYARALAFSRQMLINDQYDAIRDVLNSYADRVVAFEDRLFWSLVLSNTGAGPTLISTTRGVFNTTDGTLAAAGAAPSVTSVAAGRVAMRKRTSLDGLFVQSEPKFIVGGPDQETSIDQILAEISVNDTSKVNPFAAKLAKIITPEIPGLGWFLFADPEKVPTFIYSLLDGYTAPRLTFDTPFDTQGLKAKVEHDVGFAAVDHRGAYRNAGS